MDKNLFFFNEPNIFIINFNSINIWLKGIDKILLKNLYKINTYFQKGRFKIEEIDMTLADTVSLMNSADYNERFKAEYYQMKIRCNRLEEMICRYNNGTLGFTPVQPIEFFSKQLKAMKKYLEILEERAKLEKIEL